MTQSAPQLAVRKTLGDIVSSLRTHHDECSGEERSLVEHQLNQAEKLYFKVEQKEILTIDEEAQLEHILIADSPLDW